MRRSTFLLAGIFAVTAPIAASANGTLRPLAGGPFEASGAVFLPGSDGVLFVDDGRPGEVLWLPLSADGAQSADVVPVPIGVSVADPEGITTDGTWVYVVGSLSRGKGASLVRFRFDAAGRRASGAESMTGLESLLETALPAPSPAEGRAKRGKRKSARGVNVEGLAWDPKGQRLLLGLRSPVVDGSALIVPLRMRDAGRALAADNVAVDGPALPVPLGGLGIRGIEHDPASGAFQIIAGDPKGVGESRLVLWTGPGGTVRTVQDFSGADKPEGVARATLGRRSVTVVLFDSSHFAVLP